MSNAYRDNETNKQLLSKLEGCATSDEAQTLINQYYPCWLITSMPAYCVDYPSLTKNWQNLCQHLKTTPATIVLVEEIKFDEAHSNLQNVCEFLTKNGYCVRRVGEFTACPICNKAIPCVEIWDRLKQMRMTVPRQWSPVCSVCNE